MSEKLIDVATLHRKGYIYLMKGKENILGLQNPDDFSCNIHSYITSHKIMKIWIHEKSRDSNGFLMHLTGVHYFSGFTNWHGANFRLLTDEESMAFTGSLGRDTNGFIVEINSGVSKIYISSTKFELQIGNYIPQFIDGIEV
ncbi:MAG: hypothetical protein SFZ02_07250 [bacterium]|nr:hypothetical protein [bacterium]